MIVPSYGRKADESEERKVHLKRFCGRGRTRAPSRWPGCARACVKSADTKFGNDQILDMRNFDEMSRWIGWSKNEFSHSLAQDRTHAWHANLCLEGWQSGGGKTI